MGHTEQDMGLLAWLIIGIVAGALAGRVVEGRGFGCLGDLVVGIAGALIGGILMDSFAPNYQFHFLGTLVVAFIGACLLLAVLRLISGGRRLGGGGYGQYPLGWGRRRGRWW